MLGTIRTSTFLIKVLKKKQEQVLKMVYMNNQSAI